MTDRHGQADEELAATFARIARALQAELTPDRTLEQVTAAAVRTVEGCDHAAISMARKRGPITTRAATDEVPDAVDAIQYETRQGPCLETIEEHDSYLIDDLTQESRWPMFSRRAAAETGVRSILSLRLFVENGTIGALNLYSRNVGAFDGRDRAVGAVLAAHAAVAISNSWQREQAESMAAALDTNREIGVAIGILMAGGLHTRERAFAALREASQRLHVKLRDVASSVADTGELPDRAP